ncbi:dihydroneopterin aldolase [Thalassospira marina]|uniref:7,8-dihydroneopterin aldolase n=1 Tax=Thalassospira marina TaxID=2048283 RepID=A0ABM6QDE4_9PROT|nr:dihydroneopterin aldolase [Thalassospira marina]AUG54217.1 dihydroneopterin aldolase [Thalassospira marina]
MTAGLKQDDNITTLPYADQAGSLRRVFVRDMVINTSIGVYDFEKEAPQRVRINLDLSVVEGEGPKNDDLDSVLCYEELVKGVRAICADGHVNLVETLSENIAAMCLTDRRVRKVCVRVEKLDVFEDVGAVGVEIERFNLAR